MSTQISLQLNDRLYAVAVKHASENGYDSVQELIRGVLRERLFDAGRASMLASEASLAKTWLTPEEEDVWAHLQEGI